MTQLSWTGELELMMMSHFNNPGILQLKFQACKQNLAAGSFSFGFAPNRAGND